MQDYFSVRIDANPCSETITDLLAAFMGDIGYESFTPDENGLTAFIQDKSYDKALLDSVLSDFPMEVNFKVQTELIKGENWNEEWEKHYFQPIMIDDEVVVHSSFHHDVPRARFDIVIDPKMAFGTGHHSTTSQMMRHILSADMKGKKVIDMGTGTGILAILCNMRGAEDVVGIEIDPYAWENAVENVGLNKADVKMVCGDATSLEGMENADYFLANINRNVILDDIHAYAKTLSKGGEMFLSGFYHKDVPIVEAAAANEGLSMKSMLVDNDWAAIRLVKTY